MKTKIVSVILAMIILLSESSCFFRAGTRKHGVEGGVGFRTLPVENQQQRTASIPTDNPKDAGVLALARK